MGSAAAASSSPTSFGASETRGFRTECLDVRPGSFVHLEVPIHYTRTEGVFLLLALRLAPYV